MPPRLGIAVPPSHPSLKASSALEHPPHGVQTPMYSLTILGGGNTAFAVAANLSLAGYQITLCEHPAFRSTVEPIHASKQIELDGIAHGKTARLHLVTTDFAEALAKNDLILLIVPAYAHKPFAESCAPHLRPGQVVVLMP